MAYDAKMTLNNISAAMIWDVTINRNHVSATTTYVIWREERLWNVRVLQRVRLSNLVTDSH
jgi:hypothetical protein